MVIDEKGALHVLDTRMRPVGEIELSDLATIGRLAGHEGLPYPFAHTRASDGERQAFVSERFDNRDFAEFREWTDAYVAADIWVTCRVHHRSADMADGRILGFRGGDVGYLARQRSDDVVEIFALPADDLGAASSGLAGLIRPGPHPRIVVPGYIGYFDQPTHDRVAEDEHLDVVSVLTAVNQPAPPNHRLVADDDVAAIAIIQSRCQPAREWGVDWGRPLVACVHVDDEGDYIYAPDFSHAVPVTVSALGDRIDRLIADDITALSRRRGVGY